MKPNWFNENANEIASTELICVVRRRQMCEFWTFHTSTLPDESRTFKEISDEITNENDVIRNVLKLSNCILLMADVWRFIGMKLSGMENPKNCSDFTAKLSIFIHLPKYIYSLVSDVHIHMIIMSKWIFWMSQNIDWFRSWKSRK